MIPILMISTLTKYSGRYTSLPPHSFVELVVSIFNNLFKSIFYVKIDGFKSIYFNYIYDVKAKYVCVKPYSDRKNY